MSDESNLTPLLYLCPRCNREWEENSEQAICIKKYSECICCKFTPEGSNSGEKWQLNAIAEESRMLRGI